MSETPVICENFTLKLRRSALTAVPEGSKAIGVLFANPQKSFLSILVDESITEKDIREVLLQIMCMLK